MAAILSVSSHRDVSVAGQAYPISDQKEKRATWLLIRRPSCPFVYGWITDWLLLHKLSFDVDRDLFANQPTAGL